MQRGAAHVIGGAESSRERAASLSADWHGHGASSDQSRTLEFDAQQVSCTQLAWA